ncbi:MAG: hypothetical protein ACRDQ4_13140 [Pseudonocardiaceae bacterium]
MRFGRTTGAAAPDAGAPTLIGVDDLTTPSWAKVGEAIAGSGTGRALRAAPLALGVLLRLAWQTSPRLTVLAAGVQLVCSLYRNAPLLVADEPTAAMDARAEHAVFQSLQSLRRTGAAAGNGERPGPTRTTVLITHRLANIRHADQIIVLDHGRITEHGTHDELMTNGGGYAELFTLQAKAYLDGTDELSQLSSPHRGSATI